jgi:NTE family protein
LAPSLLDPTALAELIDDNVAWDALHDNLRERRINALVVAALEISTGRTTLFAELAPGVEFVPSRDPRRSTVETEIDGTHVLASAALPFLFPPRRIGREYFCDGGVRFNTPIAPAIRAGADRLLVISPLYEDAPKSGSEAAEHSTESYANPIFLIGKLLNALLLDPTRYDLQVLERYNSILSMMEKVLTPAQMQDFHDTVRRERNLPYRRLKTLVFRPTEDIGELAHSHKPRLANVTMASRLLMRVSSAGTIWQSDFLSFLLFDGEFARTLIELGRKEAHQRAEEIASFFDL